MIYQFNFLTVQLIALPFYSEGMFICYFTWLSKIRFSLYVHHIIYIMLTLTYVYFYLWKILRNSSYNSGAARSKKCHPFIIWEKSFSRVRNEFFYSYHCVTKHSRFLKKKVGMTNYSYFSIFSTGIDPGWD